MATLTGVASPEASLPIATDGIAYLRGVTDAGGSVLIEADADTSLTANSDARIATQKAVKAYVDAIVAVQDAMVFKGVIDCSGNPNYPAANCGWTYMVSVAGKIGGGSGRNVEAGDLIICITDGTSSGDHATVGANWTIIQANIVGALTSSDIGVSVQGYHAKLAAIAGMTWANGQFMRLTGTGSLAAQSIIGTVSQSGGVATGAIFEQGSNANGYYIKYASGVMECFHQRLTLPYVGASRCSATWTFPAAFVDANYSLSAALLPAADADAVTTFSAGSSAVGARNISGVAIGIKTTSSATVAVFATTGTDFIASDNMYASPRAVGRWF